MIRRIALALAFALALWLVAKSRGADATFGATGYHAPATALTSDTLTTSPLVRVIDGDTLIVLTRGRAQTVRLIGIDTPETRHPGRPVEPYGREATQFARLFLGPGPVLIEPDSLNPGPDRYGRSLAYVYRASDRACLNDELLRAGLARVERRWPFRRKAFYLTIERAARAQGRGLWSLPGYAPARPPVAVETRY